MLYPLNDLNSTSRVFVYLANRTMSASEQTQLLEAARMFASNWTSHDAALAAGVEVLHDQVLVFAVDQEVTGASGCSLDKLSQFVKGAQQNLNINFLDRLRAAYQDASGTWKNISAAEMQHEIKAGNVNGTTKVINTLPENLGQVRSSLVVNLADSWMNRYLTPVKA